MPMKVRARDITEMKDMPAGKLLLQLSWPVILSLAVQSAYSMVDGIFLSRLGEEVLSAVSLAAVAVSLLTAFVSGLSTGINAVISKALGAEDYQRGRDAALSGCVFQLILALIGVVCGIWLVPAYFAFSTGDAVVTAHGISYLRPLFLFAVASISQVTLERLLQSTGLVRYMLYSQITGCVVNIVLDYAFIFGNLGFPEMGVAGAAYATLIGQLCASLVALYFNVKKNRILFDGILTARMDSSVSKEVVRIGIPSSVMGITGALGNYCINWILIQYAETANAAFGVYIKLQTIALTPSHGFFAGLVTMYAFFYGCKNMQKLKETMRSGLKYIGGWNLLCTIAFVFFPRFLFSPFHPTDQMLEIGLPAFRIIGSTMLVSGYMLVLNSFLQAVGMSVFSLAVSLSRQVFVRIPAALLLMRASNINLIWLSWPISEVVSDAVCIAVFIVAYRRIQTELSS